MKNLIPQMILNSISILHKSPIFLKINLEPISQLSVTELCAK